MMSTIGWLISVISLIFIIFNDANGQSYVDPMGTLRLDIGQYQQASNFWGKSLNEIKNILGSTSWYAQQVDDTLQQKAAAGIIDNGQYNLLSPNYIWTLSFIPPPDVNLSTVKNFLESQTDPYFCRPEYLKTLIEPLRVTELEELVDPSIMPTKPISIFSNYSLACLKQFSMTYMLKRAPNTFRESDIDLLLPAGLFLLPSYMARDMPVATLVQMLRVLCQMGTPWQPDKQVSTLFLRAIIDETYVKCKASGYPMPDATELCLCIPYMRRPIIEELANGGKFGETNTQNCYKNSSSLMKFDGEFHEPGRSPAKRKYHLQLYYKFEQCRYARSAMVEWDSLSKTFHKVNLTYHNIINCLSMDRRIEYRKDNISVAWASLSEQRAKALSLNDREDCCLAFRGDFNLGKIFLTEQSFQKLRDAISCIANFEIRRIPNVYLCLKQNLQRFAEEWRPIQREVLWEVARKCSYFLFKNEKGQPLAPYFGRTLEFWPIRGILAATDGQMRQVFTHIQKDIERLNPVKRRLVANAITRPYNDSMWNLQEFTHCQYNSKAIMSTIPFSMTVTTNQTLCTNYGTLTFSQKLAAAKIIIENSPEVRASIWANNVTLGLLAQYNLDKMLEALPFPVYNSFMPTQIIEIASTIIESTEDLDTNRVMLLSNAVLAEFRRRAHAKYGDPEKYLLEMTEPILDRMPCQLMMNIHPYEISSIQGDLVTCRTLSRRWASCPHFLMKTQSYRDFVCNVFFSCGNAEPDYDHFVDDVGVYCFCNLSSSHLVNLTNAQVVKMYPVLSELPNCLSQWARIMLTTKTIDAYPPKTYLTELTPPAKEAWLTEIGKLACNLNAAIISERYLTDTFGSQMEYFGRLCCFNWTVSGTKIQRKLMAGVYFNKSADDMWDVRKMCERMFNTTAYIVKGTAEAAAEENARKKREAVVAPNCTTKATLGMNDSDTECMVYDEFNEVKPVQSYIMVDDRDIGLIQHRRHKRDVSIDGFVWTCPLLKTMTKDSFYLLTETDLNAMKHLDFVRCLSVFGESNDMPMSFYTAVIKRIRVELSRYFSFCDTDPRILEQIGYTAMALEEGNITCINITAGVIEAFGRIDTFTLQQQRWIADRYFELARENNTKQIGMENLVLMGHILCGVPQDHFTSLSKKEFESLIPLLSKLKKCFLSNLNLWRERTVEIWGPVSDWKEEHFVEAGLIVAGMTQSEASSLTFEQLRWLPENALMEVQFVSKLSADQLQKLLPEQARQIWPNIDTRWPLNETLTEEQFSALIIAEMDEMYVAPPDSIRASANALNSSLLFFIIDILFFFFAL